MLLAFTPFWQEFQEIIFLLFGGPHFDGFSISAWVRMSEITIIQEISNMFNKPREITIIQGLFKRSCWKFLRNHGGPRKNSPTIRISAQLNLTLKQAKHVCIECSQSDITTSRWSKDHNSNSTWPTWHITTQYNERFQVVSRESEENKWARSLPRRARRASKQRDAKHLWPQTFLVFNVNW